MKSNARIDCRNEYEVRVNKTPNKTDNIALKNWYDGKIACSCSKTTNNIHDTLIIVDRVTGSLGER